MRIEITNYADRSLAVGMVMMDEEGYDEMAVFHGVIRERNSQLFFESANQAPFEMSTKWLEKIKPTSPEMGTEFHGADFCLIIASITKPAN